MAKPKEFIPELHSVASAFTITKKYPSFFITKYLLFSDNTYLKDKDYDLEPLGDALNRLDKLIMEGTKL